MLFKLFVANYFFVFAFCKINIVVGIGGCANLYLRGIVLQLQTHVFTYRKLPIRRPRHLFKNKKFWVDAYSDWVHIGT